jgi:hypothetical protein
LVLAVSALAAWWWSRGRRIDEVAALSRLDVALGLHHRLVSAAAGVGEWPSIPADARDPRAVQPLRWRWPRAAVPVALSALAIGLAVLLPMTQPDPAGASVHHEPPGWAAVESVVEELAEREVVEEQALEEVRERVDALRRQPREEWYRQGSLEATDHVRQQVERDAQRLQQALEKTAALLEAAEARRDQVSQAQLDAMSEMMKELLDQLGAGTLPLNEALMQQLRNADLSGLRAMTAAELAALEQRLREQSAAVSACLAASGMACDGPGTGGVSRGPGTLPLSLLDDPTAAEAAAPLPLSNEDLSRAALGDMLGLADGAHEVDATAGGPREAGATASPGGAGEATWQQAVLPSEQRILKAYFQERTSTP